MTEAAAQLQKGLDQLALLQDTPDRRELGPGRVERPDDIEPRINFFDMCVNEFTLPSIGRL